MKRIKLLFVFLSVLFMTVSCSDFLGNQMKDSNLYGKWKVAECTYSTYENGQIVESKTDYYADYNEFYQFNSDGTGQYVYTEGNDSEVEIIKSWIILDDSLVISFKDDDYDYTIKFKINYMNRSDLQISSTEEETYNGKKRVYEEKFTLHKI